MICHPDGKKYQSRRMLLWQHGSIIKPPNDLGRYTTNKTICTRINISVNRFPSPTRLKDPIEIDAVLTCFNILDDNSPSCNRRSITNSNPCNYNYSSPNPTIIANNYWFCIRSYLALFPRHRVKFMRIGAYTDTRPNENTVANLNGCAIKNRNTVIPCLVESWQDNSMLHTPC